jgi:hypothetical protein
MLVQRWPYPPTHSCSDPISNKGIRWPKTKSLSLRQNSVSHQVQGGLSSTHHRVFRFHKTLHLASFIDRVVVSINLYGIALFRPFITHHSGIVAGVDWGLKLLDWIRMIATPHRVFLASLPCGCQFCLRSRGIFLLLSLLLVLWSCTYASSHLFVSTSKSISHCRYRYPVKHRWKHNWDLNSILLLFALSSVFLVWVKTRPLLAKLVGLRVQHCMRCACLYVVILLFGSDTAVSWFPLASLHNALIPPGINSCSAFANAVLMIYRFVVGSCSSSLVSYLLLMWSLFATPRNNLYSRSSCSISLPAWSISCRLC